VKYPCCVCGRKMSTAYWTYAGKHYCRAHMLAPSMIFYVEGEGTWKKITMIRNAFMRTRHKSKAET